MELEQEFGLALEELESSIDSTSFAYLKSILREKMRDSPSVSSLDAGPWSLTTSASPSLSLDMDSDEKSKSGKSFPFSGERLRCKSNKGLKQLSLHPIHEPLHPLTLTLPLNLSPGDKVRVQSENTLCAHLYPICRKILARTPPLPTPPITLERQHSQDLSLSSNSCIKSTNNWSSLEDNNCSYGGLIGVIVDPSAPLDFARCGLRDLDSLPKKWKGVVDFSHPISNPLYKVYDPKGVVKSEEQLAASQIYSIVDKLNGWLSSFSQDLLHPDKMTNALLFHQ